MHHTPDGVCGSGAMKCQRCPKQATLHITEVLGEDRYDEVHLCEDCAKKYLYEPQKQAAAKASDSPAAGEEVASANGTPTCEACGISYLEFRNHGRFGCPHDYDAFKAELLPLLESIHGDTRHVGKTPRRLPRTQGAQVELTTLRRRLQQLVTEENYEEAARVRDRIKELEQG
jgi:protein arginine kinase activator